MKKFVLALFMAMAMVMSLGVVTAFAAEGDPAVSIVYDDTNTDPYAAVVKYIEFNLDEDFPMPEGEKSFVAYINDEEARSWDNITWLDQDAELPELFYLGTDGVVGDDIAAGDVITVWINNLLYGSATVEAAERPELISAELVSYDVDGAVVAVDATLGLAGEKIVVSYAYGDVDESTVFDYATLVYDEGYLLTIAGTFPYDTDIVITVSVLDVYGEAVGDPCILDAFSIPTPITPTYTVIYKLYDGADDVVVEVLVGEEYALIADPVRDGYTFGGWTLDDVEFVGPIVAGNEADYVLVAVWEEDIDEPTEYAITWELSGAEYDGKLPELYIAGDVIDLPVLAKEDFTFKGWLFNGTLINGNTLDTTGFEGDIELVAVFDADVPVPTVFTITWVYDEEFALEGLRETFQDGFEWYLPTLEKEGYVFLGWRLSINGVDGALYNDKINSKGFGADITLTAEWEEIVVEKPGDVKITSGAKTNMAKVGNTGIIELEAYGDGDGVTVTSSNATVIKVYLDGGVWKYTALKAGTAIITVKVNGVATDIAIISVKA